MVPDLQAGCSLAEGCPVDSFRAWRAKHPDAVAVSYINCTAAVKAESDWICTSANAVKVVQAIPKDKKVLFAPDRNLGRHVMRHAARDMDLWPSTCVVHETFSERKIIALKERNKDALFIAHPECEPPVLRMADYIGSTTALLKFVQQSKAKKFIIGTEPGILHQMHKAAPNKTFIEAPPQEGSCSCNECHFMKLNTLEKIYLSLRDLKPQVDVAQDIRERALVPIERMLSLS
ncbi:MAG: quinolinate synthase NadA [Sorangium cellulosum]|nr:MAG: quinolinate synthase NadA [Sorangium cellulosum]